MEALLQKEDNIEKLILFFKLVNPVKLAESILKLLVHPSNFQSDGVV
jgi:hypothetical protein